MVKRVVAQLTIREIARAWENCPQKDWCWSDERFNKLANIKARVVERRHLGGTEPTSLGVEMLYQGCWVPPPEPLCWDIERDDALAILEHLGISCDALDGVKEYDYADKGIYGLGLSLFCVDWCDTPLGLSADGGMTALPVHLSSGNFDDLVDRCCDWQDQGFCRDSVRVSVICALMEHGHSACVGGFSPTHIVTNLETGVWEAVVDDDELDPHYFYTFSERITETSPSLFSPDKYEVRVLDPLVALGDIPS